MTSTKLRRLLTALLAVAAVFAFGALARRPAPPAALPEVVVIAQAPRLVLPEVVVLAPRLAGTDSAGPMVSNQEDTK